MCTVCGSIVICPRWVLVQEKVVRSGLFPRQGPQWGHAVTGVIGVGGWVDEMEISKYGGLALDLHGFERGGK